MARAPRRITGRRVASRGDRSANICLTSDDADVPADVAGPATETELQALREALAVLPNDLLRILGVTKSIYGLGIEVSLTAGHTSHDGLLELGGDGFGNYWYLEPAEERSRVWWISHDPPELVLAGRSLLEFLARRLSYAEASTRYFRSSTQTDEPTDPDRTCRYVEGCPLPEVLAGESDENVRSFLASLPGSGIVFDLRDEPPGAGVDMSGPAFARFAREGEVVVMLPEQPDERRARKQALAQKMADDEAFVAARLAAAKPWWKFW